MQRKGPLRGKIFARCILGRLLAALFGCMTRISCRSRLVSDARRRYAARKGRFSRPRPLRERMKRKSCHGSPPGNASRRYLATVGRRGAHFCHWRALGDAPWRNIAMADSPKTHHSDILPLSDAGGTHFAGILSSASARGAHHGTILPRLDVRRTSHAPRLPLGSSPNTMPCTVRGAFAATEKVSCRLRVSMWWNEPPVSA